MVCALHVAAWTRMAYLKIKFTQRTVVTRRRRPTSLITNSNPSLLHHSIAPTDRRAGNGKLQLRRLSKCIYKAESRESFPQLSKPKC